MTKTELNELERRTKNTRLGAIQVTIKDVQNLICDSRELHGASQVASENKDWFDALCHDLGEKLLLPEKSTPVAIFRAVETLKADYNELIMAVARKFDTETRHQTALRYIQSAEVLICEPAKQENPAA
jgi:hypothetical protein